MTAEEEDDELLEFYFRCRDQYFAQSIIVNRLFKQRWRKSPIPRERWNRFYLMNLAIEENSFIREIGLLPASFEHLCSLLETSLSIDEQRSAAASPHSGPITLPSRVAATLAELKGARRIETMRTHGIAASTGYANFRKSRFCHQRASSFKN